MKLWTALAATMMAALMMMVSPRAEAGSGLTRQTELGSALRLDDRQQLLRSPACPVVTTSPTP